MRRLITYFIRKRNGSFVLDETLTSYDLVSISFRQCCNLLRGLLCLARFRKPRMMLRGRGVSITGLGHFRWGPYLKLGDSVYVNAIGGQGIQLGRKVGIGAYSRLVVSGDISNAGRGIRIGDHVGIGEFAYLGGAGGLEIGDHTIAGQYLSCHPENHVYSDPHKPVRLQGVTRKGIKIGCNCWIGSKVTILDGVIIGDNCIIAAGSVVNRSFPDNCIIGGVPAKKLRDIHAADNCQPLSVPVNIAGAL